MFLNYNWCLGVFGGGGAYQGSLGREYHACGEEGEGMKILEKKIKI